MANSAKAAFFDQYAPLAMEQQLRYGIPASVILAQAWWERGAANNLNNYFGIKADASWLRAGKPYGELKDDDVGLSKFRVYSSVGESFEDHSRFLLENPRYSSAYGCAADDYRGWLQGLQRGGYSTNPSYISNLEADIVSYGLDRFDRQAMDIARRDGVVVGFARNTSTPSASASSSSHYSMPLDGDMLLSSDFGTRIHPVSGKPSNHEGIDISVPSGSSLRATEDLGLVTRTNWNGKNGNCVEVCYRHGKDEYLVKYLHMERVDVRTGQFVNAGDVVGLSGNSGVSTGPHLDFRVSKNGIAIDPKEYLAEIAVRGSFNTTLSDKQGRDLLANLKGQIPVEKDAGKEQSELSIAQMENIKNSGLLSDSFDNGSSKSLLSMLFAQDADALKQHDEGGGLLSNLISSLFMAAIGLAIQLDHSGISAAVSPEVQQQDESDVEHQSAIVRRRRDGIDPDKAAQTASMNFDTDYPEYGESQSQGVRVS